MTIKVQQIGALVRVDNVFRNVEGEIIDPTANTLYVTRPDGVTVDYVYGTDAENVRDALGTFHVDFSITLGGIYLFKWTSTGTGQAAAIGVFRVEHSDFTVTP